MENQPTGGKKMARTPEEMRLLWVKDPEKARALSDFGRQKAQVLRGVKKVEVEKEKPSINHFVSDEVLRKMEKHFRPDTRVKDD